MKHPNQPQGKVYRFKSRGLWSEEARTLVQIPKIVLSHMVIVVGKADSRRGWVKVATVSLPISTIHLTRLNRNRLPRRSQTAST